MKISIDIDCTPDEARTFFGLPDLKPMQDAVMKEIEERMKAALAGMGPDAMLRTWMPAGLEGLEKMQRAFWSNLAGGAGGKGGKGS